MTATYLGSYSIGAALPPVTAAIGAGITGLNTALPDLQGRIAALQEQMAALASMPPFPSFGDMLVRAQFNMAQITLALATPGLPPPPPFTAAIAALLAMVESMLATMLSMQANLATMVAMQTLMAEAGLHAIRYEGAANTFGSQVQSELTDHVANGGTQTYGLALVTTAGPTWSAMQQVFRVTP